MSNPDKPSETEANPEGAAAEGVPRVSTPKIYLKAVPLKDLTDLDAIKKEVEAGTILIIKVSPLASRSIEHVKKAVNELCEFVKAIDGDIARLGEERIVVTPSGVRIWRERVVSSGEQVPTAA
jgi:hypothetical protein